MRQMFYHRLALVVFVLLHAATAAYGEPWSEKLGFPPGSKVVILNARELGVTWEMNEASKKLLTSKQISSASVVVTGPWVEEVAAWCRNCDDYDIGLSVALTNPYASLTWQLSTDDGQTSLVDADGDPWKTVVQFAVSATAEDVKREIDAQINRARKAGVRLSHISGYFGTALSRPDLTAVFLGAAKKYWLPAPVVELTPELVERFRSEGFPIGDDMLQLIRDYPLPKLDDLRYAPVGRTYEEKRDNFCNLLAQLKPGLTEIRLRPAEQSKGLQLLTKDWQQRVWDSQILSDDKVKQTMQEQNVIVTNWREIMQRYDGEPSARFQEIVGPDTATEEAPRDDS